MFDLSNKPILPPSTRLATLVLAGIASAVIGACFNGNDAVGLPCTDKSQCGPRSDCIDGYCGGVFACADGALINLVDLCNAEPDCEDDSDEDPETCGGGIAGINQCEENDGDLAYRLGAASTGAGNAIKVVTADIMGSPTPDAIVASQAGDYVRIQFELETSDPKEYFLNSPPPSFGSRSVLAFEVGEVNGDNQPDIVVFTAGPDDGAVVHVFQNMRPNPPQAFGSEIMVPEIPGAVPVGIELGRLNNDSSIDIVGIVDIVPQRGLLLVALGDSGAALAGQGYFSPELLDGPDPIGYDQFVDSAMADVDGDGLDDLLVTGDRSTGPALWVVRRNGADTVGSWDNPVELPLMAPGYLSVGQFTDSPPAGAEVGPRPDLAILSDEGLLQLMTNMDGMLMPSGTTTLEGFGFNGLKTADMNCDGYGDLIYGLTEPPEIRVIFGDGEGGTLTTNPLSYVDGGTPRGGLDVALFDGDDTPDIFTAADPGEEQTEPLVRVLVTGAE